MSAAVAPSAERKLIRLAKAAERLGVSKWTVYREMERNPLFPKPTRVRGVPLFFSDEIDRYLDTLAESR